MGTCPPVGPDSDGYVFIPRLSRRPPYPDQFFMHLTFHALFYAPISGINFLFFQAPNFSCSFAYTCPIIAYLYQFPIFHPPNLSCSLAYQARPQPEPNLWSGVPASCVNAAEKNTHRYYCAAKTGVGHMGGLSLICAALENHKFDTKSGQKC